MGRDNVGENTFKSYTNFICVTVWRRGSQWQHLLLGQAILLPLGKFFYITVLVAYTIKMIKQ